MSSFVTRIEDALKEENMRGRQFASVRAADLRELLTHFKSMEARERMHYPPHVEMLVDAAINMSRYFSEGPFTSQPNALEELRRALDYAKPGWRTK